MDFDKTFTVVGYSLGDVIAEEDLKDDQYGMLVRWASARGGAIARSYITLEERIAADYFATTGFTTTSPAPGSPDGDSLFSTSHPTSALDTVNTLSNRPSAEVNLSMAAIQAARANLNQQMSSNGVTIIENNIARLVVNPNKLEIAIQLARGDWVPDNADRNMNTMKGTFQVISWPYFRLTGAAAAALAYNGWFVQGDQHHMEWIDREQTVFDNDKDVSTRSVMFTSHRRFTLGHTDWRGMYGSKGE